MCGSDLWPYRGAEAVGIVEEVGSEVTSVRPGQFVVGSFFASDNSREICQSSRLHREPIGFSTG